MGDSYPEKCFPFVNFPSETFSDLPCTLFFNPSGIFLSQPGRVDCCTFKAGVGAVPPQFLQSMSLVGQDVDAPDMYGNTVKCDEWEGQTFKYWTVGRNDPLYKNVGHDIVFQDGPTGVTWRWGNFNVTSQPADVFELPTGETVASRARLSSLTQRWMRCTETHMFGGRLRNTTAVQRCRMTWLFELWV